MATNPGLSSTIRYLRFPLTADHRLPLQDGSACPHCASKHVQKWGRFAGRQRYRCRGCSRTFSTFTSTALRYLKRPDRWRRFLWCIDGQLTVRGSASALGVDKGTSLRWRHRLLEQWRQEPRPKLKGCVRVGDVCMPHSAKGDRSLSLRRPPRSRGEPWTFPSFQTDPVTVLVALDPSAAMVIESVGVRRLRAGDYDVHIRPRLGDVREIVGARGPLCPLARFASSMGASYQTEKRALFPTELFLVRRELRRWLRPFHGVATRRLDNYLEWFRRRGPSPPANSSRGQSRIEPARASPGDDRWLAGERAPQGPGQARQRFRE